MKTYYTQEEVQKIIELTQTMINANHYSSEREKLQRELDKVTLSIDERLAKWLEDKKSFDRLEQDGIDLLNEVLEVLKQFNAPPTMPSPHPYFHPDVVPPDSYPHNIENSPRTECSEMGEPTYNGGAPVQPCGETLT